MEGVNHSTLKLMGKSPAHYKAAWERKSKSTPAMRFGSIVHGTILEPLLEHYVEKPAGMSFTTKEGKEWKAKQTLPILSEDEAVDVQRIFQSVWRHDAAKDLLIKSSHEVAAMKIDAETGMALKGRLDMISTQDGWVADIKTTDDASDLGFSHSCKRYGYFEQAAFYLDLVGATRFFFIAVEKEAPYAVNVFECDTQAIAMGRMIYRENLDRLQQCLDENHFPAYGNEIRTISLL
jgi:hypothetical protein